MRIETEHRQRAAMLADGAPGVRVAMSRRPVVAGYLAAVEAIDPVGTHGGLIFQSPADPEGDILLVEHDETGSLSVIARSPGGAFAGSTLSPADLRAHAYACLALADVKEAQDDGR